MIALLILSVFGTLVWSAFCSGVETAFLSVGRERVLHLAREGGRKAKIIEKALADMGRTTTLILIGNNLANVAYSSATAALSVRIFGHDPTASAICGFFAAFIVLYVSEFMPKLMCSARPLRRLLMMADAYRYMSIALNPICSIAIRITDMFVPHRETKHNLTANDLVNILQDRKDGVCLSDIESALITRLLVLRTKGKPITPDAILSALRDADDL